jgi:hypothetical protein
VSMPRASGLSPNEANDPFSQTNPLAVSGEWVE